MKSKWSFIFLEDFDMKKLKFVKKIVMCIAAAVILQFAVNENAYGDENSTDIIKISDYKGLLAIKDNPSGSFELTKDIDMNGKEWVPFDFSGQLHGNGHSILNLNIEKPGVTTAVTYDGNMKTYDTVFAGLFGQINNAEISDLNLLNVKINLTTDTHCFAAAIAGYSEGSTILNCKISARINLTTTAKMFGVAGIVGFGNGSIKDTDADVTLVCVDTNVEEKDEQFMGGAYAVGYIDLENCNIKIDGYDSDHGYVHNGGLVGMYGIYPKGNKYKGKILKCNVEGKITFFEDNKDRRAYCKAYVGETLHWTYEFSGCTSEFKPDEIRRYDENLYPDMCDNNEYTQTIVESTDTEYGYTLYKCSNCGYEYKDNYTLLQADLLAIKKAEEESRKAEEESIKAAEEASLEAKRASIEAEKESVEAVKKAQKREKNIRIITIMACVFAIFLLTSVIIFIRKRKSIN